MDFLIQAFHEFSLCRFSFHVTEESCNVRIGCIFAAFTVQEYPGFLVL